MYSSVGDCRDRRHGDRSSRYGCCCSHGFRRFYTKEERLARLEAYLKDLQDEAAAVRQFIDDLKKE